MEWIYLSMVVFLFVLAAFDLWVGVSNDAVNFLNSAIGSKAARFSRLVIIASIGVFLGCVLSDGMMDIARHGIFTPEYFSFRAVMYIYLAVMVTDIVLLDVFNTFGMPTSTTVSMVFELLGAAFAFVCIQTIGGSGELGMGDYLNTAKALEVIMGIFTSVPIAFIVGSVVMYISRVIFTFDLKSNLRYKIGIFGGLAITSIIYFMLFKGLKHLSFMTQDVKDYINEHTLLILGICFVFFTVLMQLLHACRVNVLRIIVLCGTFALATAFAGNDLVNFIGVPLAGFSSYQDFTANGASATPDTFLMSSLMSSAETPLVFLFAAGAIMVFSLATSKKARNVVKTEVGLSQKNEGDEMFGSSKAARSLVRWAGTTAQFVVNVTPQSVQRYLNSRFRQPAEAADNGQAYDMLRASINLVAASLLIALGTSLKLPLSTTFVTFMIAMGSSLADRAWGRESAVFRVTGVLTVIGGWFITAGVAFSAAFIVALLMNFGGVVAVVLITAFAVYSIIHSQRRYSRKQKEEQEGDVLFRQMLTCSDSKEVLPMLQRHMGVSVGECVALYASTLRDATDGLFGENLRTLRHSLRTLNDEKRTLKSLRRRETVCLRRCAPEDSIRLSTNFHLLHNALRQMLYGLLRLAEPAGEHVDNNFSPVSRLQAERYIALRNSLISVMEETAEALRHLQVDELAALRERSRALLTEFASYSESLVEDIRSEQSNLTTSTLMLHISQETRQLLVELRVLLRNAMQYQELVNQ